MQGEKSIEELKKIWERERKEDKKKIKEEKNLRKKILALPREEYIVDEAHRIPTFRKRIPYDRLLDDNLKADEKLKPREVLEGLEPLAWKIDLPKEYLETSLEYEADPEYYSETYLTKGTAKRVLDRAIFIQGIYETAKQLNIDLDYIRKIVEPSWDSKRNKSGKVEDFDLGKMDKKDFRRILNQAARLQKKERGLESKININKKEEKRSGRGFHPLPYGFLIPLIGGIILSGLFLLSSNITGYAIGNLTNPTSSIIGAVLFVGGLIAVFLLTKK